MNIRKTDRIYRYSDNRRFPEPALCINEDNDHYFMQDPEKMTVKDLQAYIDQFAASGVTHFFMCPNGQRTSYRSMVHEAVWDEVKGEIPDNPWSNNTRLLYSQGIDPYQIWTAQCRKRKISPWITMRMNDVHFVTTPNYFRNTNFWRQHPELWRVPYAKGECWTDYAFDYSNKEVRVYHLALVNELLERYDTDGFELDWMRFGFHLTPGKEKEQSSALTEFVSLARQAINQWEEKRNHSILLSVRIPSHPDVAARSGMDGISWARDKLVDVLVVSPFFATSDFNIPIELWNERLGELSKKVSVVPAIENGVSPYPGAPRISNNLEFLYGWADSVRHRGCKSFYLFNWVYFQKGKNEKSFRTVLEKGLCDSTIASAPKRYPVCYRDMTVNGFDSEVQLPRMTDENVMFSIQLGDIPISGTASVMIGFSSDKDIEGKDFIVKVNNNKTVTGCVGLPEKEKYGHDTESIMKLDIPLAFIHSGQNAVNVLPQNGVVQNIVWVEIEIVPFRNDNQ